VAVVGTDGSWHAASAIADSRAGLSLVPLLTPKMLPGGVIRRRLGNTTLLNLLDQL
jgi:hypothetical protein